MANYLMDLRKIVGNRMILTPGARCVLLNDKDQVLLERRADFDIWGMPGGGAEIGESILETAIRELEEEIGLTVDNLKMYGYATNPEFETITFGNGDRCQYYSSLFWANIGDSPVRVASDESTAIQWFDWDNLPEDILPNMRESLKAFQEFRRTGEFQMI